MAPIVPILLLASVGYLWITSSRAKSVNKCVKKVEAISKPKDGDPHPSGNGSTWSQFWGDYRFVGVKP